jgi:glycosyltransferase involved in cell wall biosynthesis
VKLCIPIADRPEGGMFTFFGNFRRWMDANGVAHTQDEFDPDCTAVLTNSWVLPYRRLAALKRRRPGVTIAHRIDGAARDYGRDPLFDGRQCRANLAADVTIFQSAYSRFATTVKHRVIANDGPVIHNPVDVARFRPDGHVERVAFANPERPAIACVSFSANPRKGNAAIPEIASALSGANFVLCGNFPEMAARPNVAKLGYVSRERLPDILRGCHFFLMLSENEACPNVVLEALASGLPVLYRDSGGTPELVGPCGGAIDGERIGDVFSRLNRDLPEARAAAHARAAGLFSMDAIFPRYIETIAAAHARPPAGAFRRISLALSGYPAFAGWREAGSLVQSARSRLTAAGKR